MTNIDFTGLQVSEAQLLPEDQGPMNASWARVTFAIPDDWQAPQAVKTWIQRECQGSWQSYHYLDPRSKTREHRMVVRFQDTNDALMFKLRDGHRAWQTT